jgi:hypothetical protein
VRDPIARSGFQSQRNESVKISHPNLHFAMRAPE